MSKPLRSLTLPIGADNVKYIVPSSYSYNNTIYQSNDYFAYFNGDDLNFVGIINIEFNNEFCSVFYNRPLGIAQILNGSISNAKLNIYTNESSLSALALEVSVSGPLNVSILGGYNIQQTAANFMASETISLLLNNKSVTVYSGTSDPVPGFGEPGDIYIKIQSQENNT